MKASLLFSILALHLLPRSSRATLVGDPVGFVTVNLAAPANGTPASKLIGVPFRRASVFQGTNATVGPNTLLSSGSSWVAGCFTNSPYIAKLRSGIYAGRSFAVIANTNDTLTLAANGAIFEVGDTFEVFPAHTLGSLFGSAVPAHGLQAAATEADADLVRFNNNGVWTTFYHNGFQWVTTTGAISQNNLTIPPDQGVMVVRKTAPSLTVTLLGTVSTVPELSSIPGSGQAVLSPRFPLPSKLNDLGVQSCAGWRVGRSAALADTLLLWNGSDWNVFYHTGTVWKMAGSVLTQNDTIIPGGEAVVVRRKEGASGPVEMVTTQPPFSYSTP